MDHVGHRFQPAHPVAGLALPHLHPATTRAKSPSRFLIPTAPAITLRQSILTFNSPGKSRSVNPTGLSHLLLPATLYTTFGTGSVRYTLARIRGIEHHQLLSLQPSLRPTAHEYRSSLCLLKTAEAHTIIRRRDGKTFHPDSKDGLAVAYLLL